MRRAVSGIVLCVVLLAPAAASAGTATARFEAEDTHGGLGDFGFLEYVAAPGETNHVVASLGFAGVATLTDDAGVTAGEGCQQIDAQTVHCALTGEVGPHPQTFRMRLGDKGDTASIGSGEAASAILDGGEGDDTLTGGPGAIFDPDNDIRGVFTGNVISGGPGGDLLTGGPGDDRFDEGGPEPSGADLIKGLGGIDRVSYKRRRAAVKADLAGDMDDGAKGEFDQIGADVEVLVGGRGNDKLAGNAEKNTLAGGAGRDRLRPGAGEDVVDGGRGGDRLLVRDGAIDRVSCGSKRDRVSADQLDFVARGCEVVSRRGNPRLAIFGGEGSNGRFRARLGCSVDAVGGCTGTVTLNIAGRRAGSRAVSIGKGRRRTVSIEPNAYGRSKLKSETGVRVKLITKMALPDGKRGVVSRAFDAETSLFD